MTSSPPPSLPRHGLLLAAWNRRGLFLLAADLIIVFLCFLSAYYVRFHLDWVASTIPFSPEEGVPPVEPYLKISAMISLVWAFLLFKEKTYEYALHHSRSMADQVRLVLLTGLYATIFLMVVSSMFRYFLLSRLVYLIGIALSCVALILARLCLDLLDRYLCNAGVIRNRVLFLGSSFHAGVILSRLQRLNRCMQVIGRLAPCVDNDRPPTPDPDVPTLGTERDLEKIYRETPFDQLILDGRALGSADNGALIHLINFCEEKGICLYIVPDSLDVAIRRREVGTFAGLPFILLRDSSVHPVYPLVKRASDILIALAVLVAGLPLWLLIALGIKLTSKGPVFYIQDRVGLHGNPFQMVKFRSMVHRADQMLSDLVDLASLQEPVFNIRQDPRVTSFGKFLRRTSLDEVPQFINVLMGSMSIVGPRPERVELVERYDPYQRRRLKAKPGITGYQQVMSRGDPSLAKRIEYDLFYLKYQGFFLDLFILIKTIWIIIRGEGLR